MKNDIGPVTKGDTRWYNKQITSNTTKATKDSVIKYINYASAVLCSDASLKKWNCKPCRNIKGAQLIATFSNSFLSTKGYLAINNNDQAIILSFRGTKDFLNWEYALDLAEVSFSSVNSTRARVHGGFLASMESISGSFLNALKALLKNPQYSNYKIKVIGHSLGGSIATLGMIKIKDKLNLSWDRFELYTYGQPRTGNVEFAEWFNALPITVARSVNYNDPVPRLPPLSMYNYVHHTNELFINGSFINYCNSSVLEDPKCALSVPDRELIPNTHLTYYNISLKASSAC
ncbi:alpha/beta-hydrolase [Neoconidiobolus thromboides FSU 785]|nr:alpha/beta-hydrolase [Neoconidiobolus thromboides FSU 785]